MLYRTKRTIENTKKKLSETKEKFLQWRSHKKAMRILIKRYRNVNETNKILEQWIMKRILDGQNGRKEELANKRLEIEEAQLMVEFIKKLK